ncbi:MAG TPA: DUF1269 domain-containing protein [Gaiellales bacterium]|nr:DUF1269 domain-containing protein [Gaiellales bacterium]
MAPNDDPNRGSATLIVAAYDDAADASSACAALGDAQGGGPQAAVVTRAADGKLDATPVAPAHAHGGAAAGAAAGAAVGAVLGPGVVATSAAGALVGAVRDRRSPLRPVLDAIENTLPPNSAGVVIVADAGASERFDAVLRGSRRVTKSRIDDRTLEHLRRAQS